LEEFGGFFVGLSVDFGEAGFEELVGAPDGVAAEGLAPRFEPFDGWPAAQVSLPNVDGFGQRLDALVFVARSDDFREGCPESRS
jgi:hypothetical protein